MRTKISKGNRWPKGLAFIIYSFVVGMMAASCSTDDDPFFSASENDAPRIISTDIPEGTEGNPAQLVSIERTENFKFSVVVTPARYTTVSWLVDGVKIAEGDSIDKPLLAGTHTLKIVATTTKGLETSRTCLVEVRPAAGDPNPGNQIRERLVMPGQTATLHGNNMSKVRKVIIGDQEVSATYDSADDCVTYTVPNLAEGVYALKLADETGFVYGAGEIELNNNPEYPEEGGEKTVWDGTFSVTWGTPFEALKTELINLVEAGDILRVYVSGEGKGTATTAWWRNILTGISEDDEPGGRGDIDINGSMVLEYALTDKSIQLLKEQDGFLMVGDGYTISKITVEKPSETVLWEGSFNVTWGTPFDALKETMASFVKVGSILRIYVSGSGQGTATSSWWNNILTGKGDPERGDIMIDGDMVLEFVLTDLSIQLLAEQNGFLAVGDGYTITKITVE